MKRILFITNLPTPYRVDFYSELGKHSDLTVIFEGKRPGDLTFNWNDDKITTFKPVYLNENLNEKKVNTGILKYLDNKKYDAIVISCYYTYTQTFALLYMKLRGIKYYFETDGGMISYGEKDIVKKVKKFLIGGAQAYFSPSNGSDEYLNYYGAPANRINRYPFTSLSKADILQGTLSKDQKKEHKEKLGIKEDKIIITIGQFIYRKGFDVLLKSCGFIDKSVGVYIIGGSPTEEYLKMKNELALHNVNFVGFKTKSEIEEWLRAADVFVLPTREDIWGLVINEAMGFGLPVITTNRCVAGVELIKDKECIIPIEDAGALANAVNAVLADDEYAHTLSLHNLESIRNNTFENMVHAHLNNF